MSCPECLDISICHGTSRGFAIEVALSDWAHVAFHVSRLVLHGAVDETIGCENRQVALLHKPDHHFFAEVVVGVTLEVVWIWTGLEGFVDIMAWMLIFILIHEKR